MTFWDWWHQVGWLSWFHEITQLAVGLGWPALGILVVLLFRKEVGAFIGRISKIGREGVEAAPAQQTITAAPLVPPVGTLKKNLLPAYHPLADKVEAFVRAAIPQAQQNTGQSIDQILIDGYVAVAAALLLEKPYQQIFGSQIAALEYLGQNGGDAPTATIKQGFYDAAVASWPAIYQNYGFDQWLHYLVAYNLVQVIGTQMTLTAEGQAFVPYLNQQGYQLRRPG